MDRLTAFAIVVLSTAAMWLIIYDHLAMGWALLAINICVWLRFTRFI